MSRRTVTRFVLAGMLAAALAAPAAAQGPTASPAPRPAGLSLSLPSFFDIQLGFSRVKPSAENARGGMEIEIGSGPIVPSRPAAAPPCCAFDRNQTATAVAPMPREATLRLNIPTLGPVGIAFDLGFTDRAPNDRGQAIHISPGVFEGPAWPERYDLQARQPVVSPFAVQEANGSLLAKWVPVPKGTDMRFVYRLAGGGALARDTSGGWWVEAARVPQYRPVPEFVATWPAHCWEPNPDRFADSPAEKAAKPPACCGKCGLDPDAVSAFLQSHLPVKHTPLGEPLSPAAALKGTWVREVCGSVIAATFSGEELKLCLTQVADLGEGQKLTVEITLTADYAVTKEGLVHGVITGIDVNTKGVPEGADASEYGEMVGLAQTFVDSPFAFRVKQTSLGVMVSNLRVAGLEGSKGQFAMVGGLYKRSPDGSVPAAKPMKAQVYQGTLTLPSSQQQPQHFVPEGGFPLPRELVLNDVPAGVVRQPGVPQVYTCPAPAPRVLTAPPCPALDVVPLPGGCLMPASDPVTAPGGCGFPGGGQQLRLSPPLPRNVPAGEFGMMVDVFGQMLGSPPPCPVLPAGAILPPPVPTCPVPSQPNPPRVMAEGFSVPPGYPFVAVQQPGTPVAKGGITGTWVREVGPVVYVLKFAPDHVTITATAGVEVADGKSVTEGMVVSADYHLGRDGTTVVGLFTGVDALADGPIEGAGLSEMGEELARLQKALTDKPFALGVRVYGDVLMIGNVRLPELGESRGLWSPLAVLGGRYTNLGDKPLPKPKPMMPVHRQTPLQPPPTEARASAESPLLPPCVVPLRTPPRANPPVPTPSDDRIPPTATPLPVAAPVQPAPAPAPAPEAPKKDKKGKKANVPGWTQTYVTDPARIKELFRQSEEFRNVQGEWRRFWFNDLPSHLTPERIHGAIQ